jgi:tetratricopeptide (TPR) repeat protein
MERYDQALTDFSYAIKVDPNYALAYTNRADVYRALKQNDKALADYQTYVRMKPEAPDGYLALGNLYETLNLPREAVANYRQYLQLAAGKAEQRVIQRMRELEATLSLTRIPESTAASVVPEPHCTFRQRLTPTLCA